MTSRLRRQNRSAWVEVFLFFSLFNKVWFWSASQMFFGESSFVFVILRLARFIKFSPERANKRWYDEIAGLDKRRFNLKQASCLMILFILWHIQMQTIQTEFLRETLNMCVSLPEWWREFAQKHFFYYSTLFGMVGNSWVNAKFRIHINMDEILADYIRVNQSSLLWAHGKRPCSKMDWIPSADVDKLINYAP